MKKSPNRKRTLSRLMAIQIFYQYDFVKRLKNLNEIKNDVLENYLLNQDEAIESYRDKVDEGFLSQLCDGAQMIIGDLDLAINKYLKDGWNLHKLDEVLIQILRLACFELKYFSDVPLKVVIDEYVDISASFFDSKKITFVNGILENLAKEFRLTEYNNIKNTND